MSKSQSASAVTNMTLPIAEEGAASSTTKSGVTIVSRPIICPDPPRVVGDTFSFTNADGQRAWRRIVIEVRRAVWHNGEWRLTADSPHYESIGDPPKIRGFAARQWMHMGALDGVELVPYRMADPDRYPMAPGLWRPLTREEQTRDEQGRRVRIEQRVHVVTHWAHE